MCRPGLIAQMRFGPPNEPNSPFSHETPSDGDTRAQSPTDSRPDSENQVQCAPAHQSCSSDLEDGPLHCKSEALPMPIKSSSKGLAAGAAGATTTTTSSATSRSSKSPPTKQAKCRFNHSQHRLKLYPARGDGNCLFRSVSCQVYGDETWHDRVREECMDYMAKDVEHFASFVDGDYNEYIRTKRQSGTFGDNPEIQAIAELYNRPVIIYVKLDQAENHQHTEEDTRDEMVTTYVNTGSNKYMLVRGLNIFQSKYHSDELEAAPIRLLYRGGNHYDAVKDPYSATVGVGLGLSGFEPGKADRDLLKSTAWTTDIEATEREMEKAAVAASLEEAFQPFLQSSGKKKVSSSSSSRKKMRSSDDHASKTASSSSSACAFNAEEEPRSIGIEDNAPASVRELMMNGFSLGQVLSAFAIAGDSFDDMLAILLSSTQ